MGASLVAQRLKHLLAMRETWVQSLEKEMATYSSILAWRIPWTEEPGRLQSMGWQRVRHDWATSLSLFFHFIEHGEGFPGGSVVKNLPAMQEMQGPSLGWEDPLEKEMATHSSILAWRIPWTEESGRGAPVLGLSKVSESVQSLSHVRLFATPLAATCQASLSITNSWNLLKLMSFPLVMPFNHLIVCHPLLLPLAIFPSIRVFSNDLVLRIRWPKCWSFSISISSSNEHPGLISFRMDWWDLLAVQGTLRSLLQHHSSKASILWRSAFSRV